jgi:hypothetical protein
MAVGVCNAIYTCDVNGNYGPPPLPPGDPKSVSLFYETNTTIQSPPQDQLNLKRDLDRALHAITRLFITTRQQESKFRPYYVQILNLARLGLVGPNASPEVARPALASMTSELIDSEGPAVKNGHMKRLAATAVGLAVPCLILYTGLRLGARNPWIVDVLRPLSIDARQLSSFMMLWVGCFTGVVLSYGSRTTTMTLEDLIILDADFLLPVTRHLFAGTLTMVLGILLCLGVFEVKVAGMSSKQLIADPMIAYLIGALSGMSELLLPGAVAKRADSVLGLKQGAS